MEKVTLQKTDSCLTYVLKRKGRKDLLDSLNDISAIEQYGTMHRFSDYEYASLKEGDLLMWSYNEEKIFLPLEIDENMVIKFKETVIRRHIAIFEKDGLISDATSQLISDTRTPTLRIRELKDIKRKPDFVVILNQ